MNIKTQKERYLIYNSNSASINIEELQDVFLCGTYRQNHSSEMQVQPPEQQLARPTLQTATPPQPSCQLRLPSNPRGAASCSRRSAFFILYVKRLESSPSPSRKWLPLYFSALPGTSHSCLAACSNPPHWQPGRDRHGERRLGQKERRGKRRVLLHCSLTVLFVQLCGSFTAEATAEYIHTCSVRYFKHTQMHHKLKTECTQMHCKLKRQVKWNKADVAKGSEAWSWSCLQNEWSMKLSNKCKNFLKGHENFTWN